MTSNIVQVPTWVLALRGIQLLFAVIILGMSSYGIYWLRLSSWGWAIFTSLVTVAIVLYSVVPERVAAARKLYNSYAILALNAVAVVFWLAAMGALAARRSTFKYNTTISSCVNDGSGGVCTKRRDSDLQKRGGNVATYPYLNMMSAAAVFSAFEMFLFIATSAIFALSFKKQKASSAPPKVATNAYNVESHTMQEQSYGYPQQQQQQQYAYPPQRGGQQYQAVPM